MLVPALAPVDEVVYTPDVGVMAILSMAVVFATLLDIITFATSILPVSVELALARLAATAVVASVLPKIATDCASVEVMLLPGKLPIQNLLAIFTLL
jgi:hypothetical protein